MNHIVIFAEGVIFFTPMKYKNKTQTYILLKILFHILFLRDYSIYLKTCYEI
jgi:hypothetical protein